jgi:hypothetical protein
MPPAGSFSLWFIHPRVNLSPAGASLSPTGPQSLSNDLREASEGSSIGLWERAAQTNHRRTNA